MVDRRLFPNLGPLQRTSAETPLYNCIAWAFGDNTRKWWPNFRGHYWPTKTTAPHLEAFEALFARWGWQETDSRTFTFGYQKIALYALDGKPKHAAKQLVGGMWSSKLGGGVDITHRLEELEGPFYGSVLKIYEKPA